MKNFFYTLISILGSSLLIILLFFSLMKNQAKAANSADNLTSPAQTINQILVKFKNKPEPSVFEVKPNELNKMIDRYKKNPQVEYAEPNYLFKAAVIPTDTYYNQQWYLQKIGAPKAWAVQQGSPKITIAIIDSGVQIDHPDLKNNIWHNPKEIPGNGKDDDNNGFIDDVNGWDFVNNTADPNPKFQTGFTSDVMHGTIVAGIAAAEGNNATGVSGVTWKAQIMPLKVLNDNGEGTAANVIKAIDYAIINKADIINLSFVGFNYSQGMDEAIRRAYNAGIIVVAAAGNESTSKTDANLNDKPMYPVCLDGRPGENRVIGVAATDAMDQKTYFSGYGSNCVDITAPGISIFSTVANSPTNQLNGEPLNKLYDGYWSGTSVATPIISGSIALIEGANPGLSRTEVIKALLNNADNINRLNPKYIGQLGSGRVDLSASINAVKNKLDQVVTSIIVAPQTDHSALTKIINQQDNQITDLTPYDNFNGGVNLAVGDVDGDGQAEIITGAGPGGGPHVKIFTADGKLKGQFFAYNQNFRGGVNLAVGDVDGDGQAEIITGAGPGGGPQIRIFNRKLKAIGNFFAYEKTFKGGVKIAVGDIDGGTVNKNLEIITAPGPGRNPQIKIFDNHANLKSNFLAYDQNFKGGVNIAAADTNKDGLAEIITGAGPGGGPHVRLFDSAGKLLGAFYAYEDDFKGGVNVGAIQY